MLTSSLDDTKYILKKYNLKANKRLGQNFLVDDNIINNIIESANLNKNSLVIEIGPGLGTLTAKLLERAGKVIAVELDERMIKILNDRFNLYDNFTLINDDILKVDLKGIIDNNLKEYSEEKIVANLPYYITTPIIMKLLEERLNINSIIVMIQKEVADRITATPGDKLSGAITYSVNYYAEAEQVEFVSKNSFIPAPEVDSEVIKLKIRKEPAVLVEDERLFFKLIKASFMQRRKTLKNGLINSGLIQDKNSIDKILIELNIDPEIRGEKLNIEQFAKLSNFILKKL